MKKTIGTILAVLCLAAALLLGSGTVLVLAAVLVCTLVPAAFAEEEIAHPTTIGGADTTLVPVEEENCLSWLFGSKDKITMPYLNIKGKGLRRNVTLDLVDCLVGITYTELGSIGSFVSSSAAQQAWKAQAVAIHSYLLYQKQYGSSANALVYTPVDQIPSSAREALRKAIEPVKDEVLTYNGSVIDAVWSASAGYNTQTGVYGTCSGLDAWGTDVPYLQSVESPYEEQYHNLMRRIIGKDYRYTEYNDSKTGQPYESADTTHKDLGGYVQYNTFVSNGRSYRNLKELGRLFDHNALRTLFAADPVADIHGDLTVENIICRTDVENPDKAWYIIDPNTGNLHDSPYLDYGKLLQSLHGGYEFMMMTPRCTVQENHIDFQLTRSAAYDTLFEAVCDDLRARCGAAGLHSILAHELIHWLRLMPYKLNKDKKRAPMFYAGLVMVANDLNTWENEGKFDEKARTDRR